MAVLGQFTHYWRRFWLAGTGLLRSKAPSRGHESAKLSVGTSEVARRAEQLAEKMRNTNYRNIDRLFVWLMLIQWCAGIVTALFVSPYTWIGSRALVHEHVWAAIVLGAVLSAAPVWLGTRYPGHKITRHVIAVSQALWGALLIHLSGGRIETHFHIFGSLAFIAFYRDCMVLLTMTAVIAADHAIRGIFFPLSVYGIVLESSYRWLEHAGWVLCEDIVLFLSCRRGSYEVQQICLARAELEATNLLIEQRVVSRTSELRDTTEFFRAVLDSIHANVCVLDHAGRIVEVNDLWRQRNLKFPEHASYVGDDYIAHCYRLTESGSHGAAEVAETIKEVLETGKRQLVSEFAIGANDETRWYQVNISAVSGHNRGAAVVAQINVTGRIVAERELLAASGNLRRLSLIAKHTDNAVCIMEADGRVSAVNDGFERLYGYTFNEVKGLPLRDILAGPESDADTLAFMEDQFRQGRGFDVELREYRKSGEAIWVSMELRPIYSVEGQLQQFISLARDITQKREQQQSLQLLREAIDNTNDAMFIIDADGSFVDVNTTACRRLGYTREELLQLSLPEIEHSLSLYSWPERWEAVTNGDVRELNGTHRTKDGQTFPVELSAVPVSYNGKAYFCAFAHDISERKQAEREHERLNIELRNAARQAGMAEVAADVLHNVGNALNSINVSTQLLKRQLSSKSIDLLNRVTETIFAHKHDLGSFFTADEQGCMFPELLHQLGQRLNGERMRQSDEILELMLKIEHVKEVVSGQKAFSHHRTISEAILPADIFQEALRMQSFSFRDAGITVDSRFAEIDEVFLEKHQVLQILINLIKNAGESVVEAEAAEPRVQLITRTENEFVCFEVNDNGIGIANENLVEIFHHGFTTKPTGHGFGLHSCANLAQDMGGTLTVRSRGIGCGARFILKLPKVVSSVESALK